MKNNPSILERIARFFGLGKRTPDQNFSGSRHGKGIATTYQRKLNLDVPEIPLRPILGDLNNSYELLEIETWCYEASHAIWRIASDCFQSIDGGVGSWQVNPLLPDGSNTNPDIVAIANDLASRMHGKHHVLGGNRLKRAIAESLFSGDSFVELAISKEGLGRKDYGISDSLYLPRYSMFVNEDEHGQILEYQQRARLQVSQDDILIAPFKVLHFSYNQKSLYGTPITFQSLEPWRKLKACSMDLEQAARDCGVAPWLHIMPEGRDDTYREQYRQRFEGELSSGIITNLYLLSGAEIRKASTDAGALKPLMDYWLSLRYQCLPPGIPHWFFPGMGLESGSGKDIANQPAMNYARMISDQRALIGEQVKWAISVELVLQKGIDWYIDNHQFDIIWPKWFVTGMESDIMQEGINGQVHTGNSSATDGDRAASTASRN